jgi:hypothetical protein
MLFIQIVQPSLPRNIAYSASPLLWVIAHTQLFFPLLLGGLMLIVQFGFRLRRASPGINGERQSLVDSARAELTVLLGLLLGFSLPMALPHYKHRNELVVDEANAIMEKIDPAVTQAKTYAKADDLVESAIKENVRRSAMDIVANSEIIRNAEKSGKLTVIEAEYELDAGRVVRLNAPANAQN